MYVGEQNANGTSTDRLAYYSTKQAMQDVLVEAKSNYFRNSLVNANPKDAFRIVNELTTTPRQIPAILDTPQTLANEFSKFFTDKVKNIRSSIDDHNVSSDVLEKPALHPDCILSDFCTVSPEDLLSRSLTSVLRNPAS